ncbi:hypothetical protein PtA15_3A136 [Puccinia triticina]|uniref:Uncharacterized protein n=1 Tax=Puccinia triticina TaxID=208348 RepID=A0ABY7CFQ3_9BASI|nr:uncharacterized protein PtA15_3A136 [Puccinia triticina]WAQ82772.1 hypothetical protein PtA15_3A136 [Puccinia triticina]WAR53611.1 hypothetical protein PtB15_3B119 [Puccinia triticina]
MARPQLRKDTPNSGENNNDIHQLLPRASPRAVPLPSTVPLQAASLHLCPECPTIHPASPPATHLFSARPIDPALQAPAGPVGGDRPPNPGEAIIKIPPRTTPV